jgi:hypothetical protein
MVHHNEHNGGTTNTTMSVPRAGLVVALCEFVVFVVRNPPTWLGLDGWRFAPGGMRIET